MELKTKFITKNLDSRRRILVTSDIHGHYELFCRLLSRAGFCEEDYLVIVGDIIEKGYESLKTLRYIMRLCERGNVIPLLGNVDASRLKQIKELDSENAIDFFEYLCNIRKWSGSIWDEMTSELGKLCQSPEELLLMKDKVCEHFGSELEFLSNLSTVVETQKYVFVHGGLRDTNISANELCKCEELLKYDNFYNAAPAFEKYIVVGHYPTTLYDEHIACCNPKTDTSRKIISIDGGCGIKDYGQLNLLIIPDIDADITENRFIAIDELPNAAALEAQSASEDSINLRWIDNCIKTLERGEEFSRIRHLSSEHELWIPNEYLYDDSRAKDYSDYMLPVEPGDTISLVHKTSRGWLAKKDGIFGWYLGKVEAAQSSSLKLVRLTPEYGTQLIDMMDEWTAAGEEIIPSALTKYDYHNAKVFADNIYDSALRPGKVPSTLLFCLDEERNIFVGAVNIRHYLNDSLKLIGGHIGDGVRPSERRNGIATKMLGLALDECKRLGIDRVLMTCYDDNIGSARSIENNGGILENKIEVNGQQIRRYFINL